MKITFIGFFINKNSFFPWNAVIFQFIYYRISEVCDSAEKLINDSHPEIDQINSRKNEVLDAWNNLKAMAVSKQEKLFGAHEIQRFNRDADETIGKEKLCLK